MLILLFFYLLSLVESHPLCKLGLENFQSPVARELNFCSKYSDLTCCSVSQDLAIELEFNQTISTGMSQDCLDNYKDYLCAECSPYQSHLFSLEATFEGALPRNDTILCQGFCNEFAASCPMMNLNCSDPDTVDIPPWCFPVTFPTIKTGGLSVYHITDENTAISYVDRGDDKFWILTQTGFIYEIDRNTKAKRLVLDVSDIVNYQQEAGALAMALHPRFEENKFFFVYMTIKSGDIVSGVSNVNTVYRFKDSPGVNNDDGCMIIRFVKDSWNHNGGELWWDNEENLFLSIGDASPQRGNGNGQDTTNLFGSIIRITPIVDENHVCDNVNIADPTLPENLKVRITNNYLIPNGTNGNPFYGLPGFRDEIWDFGFRNPFRVGTNLNGSIVLAGDVGQNRYEEVNRIRGGGNYGWEITEGYSCFATAQECANLYDLPNYVDPVYVYPHPNIYDETSEEIVKGWAIIMCDIYEGSIRPDLYGTAIFCDYYGGCYSLRISDKNYWSGAVKVTDSTLSFTACKTDKNGEMKFISPDGFIYEFASADDEAAKLATYGNHICEPGESCDTHPVDCAGQLTGAQVNKWCCTDGQCEFGNCPVECNATYARISCGNGFCETGEDCHNCAYDCPGRPSPGNEINAYCCVGSEDEGGAPTCVPNLETSSVCDSVSCGKGKRQGPGNGRFNYYTTNSTTSAI